MRYGDDAFDGRHGGGPAEPSTHGGKAPGQDDPNSPIDTTNTAADNRS